MSQRSFIRIDTYTWSKDSHGLFDYENGQLSTGKFKITGQANFYRKNNEIVMGDPSSMKDQIEANQNPCLFQIQQHPLDKNRFFLSQGNNHNTNHNLGLVVRGIKNGSVPSGYELKVGDHIKIGRVNFIVKELKNADGQLMKLQNPKEIPHLDGDKTDKDNVQSQTPICCRICLEANCYPDPIDNTLINPCKCRGSCEYVHIRCLKSWVESKQQKVETDKNICLYFKSKSILCEICKENLPYAVKLFDQEAEIVEIKKPTDLPYIILEKTETSKENKGMFLIKASEENTTIGRGHVNSIIVSDISVSREHAFINYQDGKFMIFDNNSKFGTLVEINQPVEVRPETTIIQCGKTVIIFSLQRKSSLTIPKIVEPIETLNSPRTPSSINESDEQKQMIEEEEMIQNEEEEDSKTQLNALIEEPEIVESKLLAQSKKIFKIIKPKVGAGMGRRQLRRTETRLNEE